VRVRRLRGAVARIGDRRSANSSDKVTDNQAMSIAQTPGHRKLKFHPAAIGLAVLHVALVCLTLLLSLFYLVSSLDDPHGECSIHGLYCDRGAHIRQGVLIGVAGTATLVILEFLMLFLLRKHRLLSVVVPILCCIGQFILMGTIFLSDNAVPASG
jgi:hypothetical protein